MRQVRLHGPEDVRVDDVSAPTPGPRDAVVRVAACGVCGSDVSYCHMGNIFGRGPLALGHEMAGVVDAVGAEVVGLAVGDRVVVHPGDDDLGRIGGGAPEGGLGELLLVREAARGDRLVRVPDHVPLDVAALAEPLAVAMRAVDRAEVAPGDSVAVFGCGPIGLLAIATLLDRGITDVVAVDLSPRRLDLARGLGAQAALDPTQVDVWDELKRLHGTAPFMFGPTAATNAFIEASGAAPVIGDVIRNARVGATLSIVALHYAPIPTDYTTVLMKQLSIHGSMEYPARFEDAVDLIARRDLTALVTHRLPLDGVGDALALLGGSKDCGKVMITIGDDR